MAATFMPHPSVRIKGTETTYQPVQCFNPLCADKSLHMHCPFCVKTEAYTDPVILKAHYRVKHVDKGIEFAGLKILRCCDQCDIVGVIKGEKKFKGAHWHCYKCRNGFNRRDEAIKHFKTHFRNPQTTFQIQIAQDINQPVTQGFETEDAAACIPVDGLIGSTGLQDHTSVYSQPSGLPTVPRTLEGVVSMQGVGAIETVGLSDTQTIMIIQDDNLSSLQEATQDVDSTDNTDILDTEAGGSPTLESSSQVMVKHLELRIKELERQNAAKDAEIKALKKKVRDQNVQLSMLKQSEQSLREQLGVSKDKTVQEMCELLETQHKELIRQQLKQVQDTLLSSKTKPPTRMIIINPIGDDTLVQTTATSLLNTSQNVESTSLSETVDIQTYSEEEDDTTTDMTLELDCTSVNTNNAENVKDNDHHCLEMNETAEVSTSNNEVLNSVKADDYHSVFPDTIENSRLETEDEQDAKEPASKKRKHSVECQNL